MNALQLIQLVLALLKLANWITAKVDQSQWEKSQYKQDVADQLAGIQASVGLANQALKDAKAMTPEQKKSILKDDR